MSCILLTLTKQIINNMITIVDIKSNTVHMRPMSNISSVDDSVVSVVAVATHVLLVVAMEIV